jgi:hypothetical protein
MKKILIIIIILMVIFAYILSYFYAAKGSQH